MERAGRRVVVLAVVCAIAGGAAYAAFGSGGGNSRADVAPNLPAGFHQTSEGPDGGTVWEGRIPNPFVPADTRVSAIYLPPGYTTQKRYPVLYLLHGFWGSPSSFVDSFRMANTADELISAGDVRPFVVVMPPGGAIHHGKTSGEWAGVWERYVVDTVVPWTDAHLSTIASQSGRAIGGLSAGAFGAVDIALRHLSVFSVAESWEGYFRPFRDGPFVRATAAELAAHNPTLLVRQHAPYVRAHIRFFLSTGKSHGIVDRQWTFSFARELQALGIRYRVWTLPPGQVRFGRLQLPDALRFAEPST
jgi:S-formylglutathione hydrolase FrmB